MKFRLGFKNCDYGDPVRWQKTVREQFLNLIHFDRTPCIERLKAKSTEEICIEGVKQTRYLVSTENSEPQPIYHLKPETVSMRKEITLLTFHGHGTDPFTGIYSYVRELARIGYDVIMPILYGKMERETKDISYDAVKTCGMWSVDADAIGTTLLGMRLFDCRLAFRFAVEHLKVNINRLGTIGLSMGGELSLYLSAVEPSIPVCVSAGFLSTFKSLLFDKRNCLCYSIRNWPDYFDMPDIVGCIAPRPLQIQKGDNDPFFDSDDVASAFSRIKEIYSDLGKGENVDYVTYPGQHILNVEKAVSFIDAKIKNNTFI